MESEPEETPSVPLMLLAVQNDIEPYIEFAKGMRAEFLRQGWSAAVADAASGAVLTGSMRLLFTPSVPE